MTKITQISAAALLAVFASTAFVSSANAHGSKVWCEQVSAKIFKTACEKQRSKRAYQRPTYPNVVRVQNFSAGDLTQGPSGGGENGDGGGNGNGNGNGGTAGGRP